MTIALPSWRAHVREYDCRHTIQLHYAGRQRDPARKDLGRRITASEIHRIVQAYTDAALRVREAGADGIALVAAAACLVLNFLLSAANNPTDE